MVESGASTLPGSRRSTRPALFLEQACWVSSNTFDCNRSAAARKRNHVARGTRKAYSAFRLPISSTMQLKPPAWSSRSVTRSACSSRAQDLPLEAVLMPEAGSACRRRTVILFLALRARFVECFRAARSHSKSLTAAERPLASIRGWPPPACWQPRLYLGWFFCHAQSAH